MGLLTVRPKASLSVIACAFVALAAIPVTARAESFTIKVDGLRDGYFSNQQVYGGFGCHGENVSPRISWAHVPRGTKSLVVTIFDPDAPTGGLGWTHWEVVNIPPSESSLESGASGNPKRLPAGAVETLTDFGESAYGGPCPPKGESHRYVVTASALDVARIDVAPAASPAVVAYQMHGKVIAQAKYVARYRRAPTGD
ncbi:YbhB/YbcL family Raf kinase inhibitor-like protein [Burkholderia gladioli]|uniref:YbhB/YbcL family Raf kinase inhibitor-like protein n=1 Tax=Burkholderia gladioli TaxID=28095 RepID=UPI001FC82135|nr:YbhB/YbcL family Raf kinase inhibitor-like protein [Burkholderia gladioli]